MYIKRVRIDNIRCFEELEVVFDKPGSSLLILGDNGDGKSTVLRSLAMGLCDESSAAALFRELPGEFVRRPAGKAHVPEWDFGTICVDLEHKNDSGEVHNYRIRTRISSGKIFERVSQYDREESQGKKTDQPGLYQLTKDGPDFEERPIKETDFPWDEFFVSGYGAGSRSQGTADYRYYLPVDAVYPIFYYQHPLQNPELAVRRLLDAAHKAAKTKTVEENKTRESEILDKVKNLLAPILGLNGEDSIELTSNAILVKGHWGKAELGELGDGYRATITWILDLLSWWFLYYFSPKDAEQEFDDNVREFWGDFLQADPTGIVIIDEIDQHLHPKWQHSILKSLTTTFPKIQFIATTHSPMTVIGTTDVDEDDISLIVLKGSEQGVIANLGCRPNGMRADQVLTSSLFGLPTASDNAVKRMVSEYASLASSSSLTTEQATERDTLKADLERILGAGETKLETIVASAVRDVLANAPLPDALKLDALEPEIRRQIQEVLGRKPK